MATETNVNVQVTTRGSQVEAQYNQLDTVTIMLAEQVGVLEERLSSVLREPYPALEEKADQEPTLVPLAEKLQTAQRGVRASLHRLESLLERLEV